MRTANFKKWATKQYHQFILMVMPLQGATWMDHLRYYSRYILEDPISEAEEAEMKAILGINYTPPNPKFL